MYTYTLDASKEPLGRMAAKAAVLLRGKNRTSFQLYKFSPVRVIITNADQLMLTGKKLKTKLYYRHSGYIGHLKSFSAEEMMRRDSRKLVRQAVWGMLPKNRLRKQMIRNLTIYKSGRPAENQM